MKEMFKDTKHGKNIMHYALERMNLELIQVNFI